MKCFNAAQFDLLIDNDGVVKVFNRQTKDIVEQVSLKKKHVILQGDREDFCGIAVDDIMEGSVQYATSLQNNGLHITKAMHLRSHDEKKYIDLRKTKVQIVLVDDVLKLRLPVKGDRDQGKA